MLKRELRLLSYRLSIKKNRSAGRNNTGSITVRHRVGGVPSRIRMVDYFGFKRLPGFFKGYTYLPKRRTNCGVYLHSDQSFSLIQNGDFGAKKSSHFYSPVFAATDNQHVFTKLYFIRKSGMKCFNIQFFPNSRTRIASAPAAFVKVLRFGYLYTIVRMPSGEIRKLPSQSECSLGSGAAPRSSKFSGKAGFSVLMGRRPSVRGVAMNPVDHPHGGNTSPGKNSVSPWAKLAKAKGLFTRKSSAKSSKLILYRRHLKKKF